MTKIRKYENDARTTDEIDPYRLVQQYLTPEMELHSDRGFFTKLPTPKREQFLFQRKITLINPVK